MPNPTIKFGFAAGELSPELIFRGDLEKYDLSVKKARNWLVDYRGGISTRPGTEFLDYVMEDDKPARLFRFRYNQNLANNFAVLFGHLYIRFLQDGAYVLESSQSVTSATTSITSNSHGYSTGDWVKINGETFEITGTTLNTFTAARVYEGSDYDFTGQSVSSVARIYTVTSPYDANDLAALDVNQETNTFYLSHQDYEPRTLRRVGAANWNLSTTTFGGNSSGEVGGVTASCSTAGTGFDVLFAVTSVNSKGVESGFKPGSFYLLEDVDNITTTATTYNISTNQVANAIKYRFYRSRVVKTGEGNYGLELGYIGESRAPKFTDPNIIPDFTISPPIKQLPFTVGAVQYVQITNEGSGYVQNTTTVSLADGSNFQGLPVVDAGKVIAVIVLDPGSGYSSSSTLTISGAGTGAAGTVVTNPASGVYPAASLKSQQRRVYAGLAASPVTLYGSRLGQPRNFGDSGFGRDDDPYILELDSTQETPIHSLVPFPDGYFAFTEADIVMVRGIDDNAITPNSAKAMPQSEGGAAPIPVLSIDKSILYLATAGTEVNLLQPANLPTYYNVTQVSSLSNHLFLPNNPIVDWAWAKSPNRIIWAARANGTFISFTFVPDQNLFAWTPHDTIGRVLNVTTVLENNEDRVYFLVRRDDRVFIERMAPYQFQTVEDQWAVDSALQTTGTTPNRTLAITDEGNGFALIQTQNVAGTPSDYFDSNDLEKIIRTKDGAKAVITEIVSSNTVRAIVLSPFSSITEDALEVNDVPTDDWTLWQNVSSVSGLRHLEGKQVQILADGNYQGTAIVTNGAVPLQTPASLVTIGLPYSADLQTLPPNFSDAIIEHRAKGINSVALRLHRTRGLKIGDLESLYERPEIGGLFDAATFDFTTAMQEIEIDMEIGYDAPLRILKDQPFHAKVLGIVMEMNLGDG